ncbi:unnamed protein product [Pylaiella littoralis]
MARDFRSWDEAEETGLRLCAEKFIPLVSPPAEVTACCWDANTPGVVGLCGADGSFVLANHESGTTIATTSYAVYFSTLPVHLWGRRGGGDGSGQPPPVASAPARRVPHSWSQVSFVPGHPGEVLFVQGWSCRVLWAELPRVKGPRGMAQTSALSRPGGSRSGGAVRGRFGLVDGSRVVALDGHEAQARGEGTACLSIDSRGTLLLTGDESGVICVRRLYGRHSSISSQGDQGVQDTADRSLGAEGGLDSGGEGGVAKVIKGAHDGGVLAITHVDGSLRATEDGKEFGSSSALFVSGGKGGIVRVWRATSLIQWRRQTGGVETTVHVDLVKDMLVGGFQVSCLRASLSLRVPIVLAGTAEGTVFAFHLQDEESSPSSSEREGEVGGDGGGGGGGSRKTGEGTEAENAQVLRSGGTAVGKTELGVVLMKFEHTRQLIQGVCCSQEQELIAVADADGIVRTYRPTTPQGNAQRDNRGTEAEERPSEPAEHDAAAGEAQARPFALVVECRLGARPALCEFAWEEGGAESSSRQDEDEEKAVACRRRGEVLRTCTVDGNLRVWPTASLPTRPVKPPASAAEQTLRRGDHEVLAPLLPLLQPSNAANTDTSGRGGSGGGGNIDINKPPFVPEMEQENRDPSGPFSRWASASDAEGQRVGAGGAGGAGAGAAATAGQGGEAEEQEPTARGEPPLPKPRPAAPRRVSFAQADQVYELKDPYYGNTRQWDWRDHHGGKEEEADDSNSDYFGEFEAPRPPPPAPTPMSASSDSAGPRRLRQTWGNSTYPHGGSQRLGSVESRSDPGVFITPSRLQEASMWSTAVEQAALEERMRQASWEGCDAGAVPEPSEPVYRTAAAAAVNIHPLAKTYEGLVPVSLDAPPPKMKRKGKQVSKSHLSKVQEQRITEEDLEFDDMEPNCSAIAGFGSSGSLWQHEELEWYGGRRQFAELRGPLTASDRVWALGRRL